MVGNFHFFRVKHCLAPRLMTTSSKILMSNKMANNALEVNERCSVSIFQLLNYNFLTVRSNIGMTKNKVYVQQDYFVINCKKFVHSPKLNALYHLGKISLSFMADAVV